MPKQLPPISLRSPWTVAAIVAAIAAVGAGIGAKLVLTRVRTEHPPVSPTIPRVQDLDATPTPAPELGG